MKNTEILAEDLQHIYGEISTLTLLGIMEGIKDLGNLISGIPGGYEECNTI